MAADGPLAGKVAIVTGGAHGIGRATALRCGAAGATVVIADVDPAGEEVARTIGGTARFVHCDVADAAQAEVLAVDTQRRFGRIDVLCNIAGISGSLRRFLDDDLRDMERVFAVDLLGLLVVTRFVGLRMVGTGGGSIVNVASGGAITPGVGMLPYRAIKAGVVHASRCLAVELGEHGIRVNCVAPANIATTINAAFDKTSVTSLQPLPHQGVVHDVADAVLFLAGDQAAYITGIVLPVDGGMSVGTPPHFAPKPKTVAATFSEESRP